MELFQTRWPDVRRVIRVRWPELHFTSMVDVVSVFEIIRHSATNNNYTTILAVFGDLKTSLP
jgi:hypothetical protein